jgi:TPR repeat protein
MRALRMASFVILVAQYNAGYAHDSFGSSCVEEYRQGHLEKALYYCHGAASDPQAQFILGKIYSMEGMASPEMKKAYGYFAAAANQNLPEAQFMMALCYQAGLGVTKNTTTAAYWYQQAKLNGLSGPNLNSQALRQNESIVIEDWPGADELRTALNILHGENSEANKSDLIAWFNASAQKGNIEAEYQLGRLYALGKKVPQNDGKAWFWFKKAADKNHQDAQSYLAWMSMLGLGMRENKDEAISWFMLANQSPPQTEASLSKDLDDIFSSLPSENTPLVNRSPESEYFQGKELLDSRLSQQDIKDGITLIDKAANEKYGPAQLYLAKLYHEGKYVEKNIPLAVKLYSEAAYNGEPEAQYCLGWMYFHGEGVPQSNEEAIVWFERASATEERAKEAIEYVYSQRPVIVLGDHKVAAPMKVKLQRVGDYFKSLLPSKNSSS